MLRLLFVPFYIITVSPITIDQFPYQASIHSQTNFLCSGAILSPKWILTTASCLNTIFPPKFVRTSSSDLTTGGQTSPILEVHTHPDYTTQKWFSNDIALILLRQRIYFDSRVKAIKMADYDPFVGAKLVVVGWGPHANSPNYNKKLLSSLSVSSVGQSQCNKTVFQLSRHYIDDDIICTGGNARGFCEENLGALLATRDGKLFGIATWTQICGKTFNYDLFVSVVYHKDFIHNIINTK